MTLMSVFLGKRKEGREGGGEGEGREGKEEHKQGGGVAPGWSPILPLLTSSIPPVSSQIFHSWTGPAPEEVALKEAIFFV